MFIHQITILSILSNLDDTGLQRRINAPDWHVHRLRAPSGEHCILSRSRLNANLQSFYIPDTVDLFLAVHVTESLRAESNHVNSLHGVVNHVPNSFEYLLVAERF